MQKEFLNGTGKLPETAEILNFNMRCSSFATTALAYYTWAVITARKRSLGRLCFHRCLSVHREGGLPHTHPGQTSPDRADTPSPSAYWDMVNKRAVYIPLECILALIKGTKARLHGMTMTVTAINAGNRIHSSL